MNKSGSKLNKFLFCLYCTLMLLLLFNRSGSAEGSAYWQQVGERLNLLPLHTVVRYIRLLNSSRPYLVRLAIINLLGNVIMFIPLGFFLPRVFSKLNTLWKMLLTTALTISIIEVVQLFTLLGSCDIDDLILNLLGAALGYALHKCIK